MSALPTYAQIALRTYTAKRVPRGQEPVFDVQLEPHQRILGRCELSNQRRGIAPRSQNRRSRTHSLGRHRVMEVLSR